MDREGRSERKQDSINRPQHRSINNDANNASPLPPQPATTPAQSLPHHLFQYDDGHSHDAEGSLFSPSSQILLAKFDSLEKKWTPLFGEPTIDLSKQNVSVGEQRYNVTGFSDDFGSTCSRQDVTSLESLGLTGETDTTSKKVPVYERLYQQGKAKLQARRKQESHGKLDLASWSPTSDISSLMQTSVAGSTISTLSSGSVFERLHRKEKRPPGSIKSSLNSVGTYRRSSHADDHLSAAASLERRLNYTPSTAMRRPRTTPSTDSSNTRKTLGSFRKTSDASDQSVTSNVFQRLYQNQKRLTTTSTEISGPGINSLRPKQMLSRSKPSALKETGDTYRPSGNPVVNSNAKKSSGTKPPSHTGRNGKSRSPEPESLGEQDSGSLNSVEAFLCFKEIGADSIRSETDDALNQSLSGEHQRSGVALKFEALHRYYTKARESRTLPGSLFLDEQREVLKMLKRNVSARKIQRVFRASMSRFRRQHHAVEKFYGGPLTRPVNHDLYDKSRDEVENIQLTLSPSTRAKYDPSVFTFNGDLAVTNEQIDDFATVIQSAWRCHIAQIRTLSLVVRNWIWECDLGILAKNDVVAQGRLVLDCLHTARKRVDCWWITEGIVQRHETQVHAKWVRSLAFAIEGGLALVSENCTFRLMCVALRVGFAHSWSRRKLATLLIKATLDKETGNHRRTFGARLIQRWWRALHSQTEQLMKAGASSWEPREFLCDSDLESTTEWFETSLVDDDDVSAYSDAMTEECERLDVDHPTQSPSSFPFDGRQAELNPNAARRFSSRRAKRVTVATATLIHTIAQRVRSPEKKIESATLISKVWRAYQARCKFYAFRRAVVSIQALFRGQLWQRHFSACVRSLKKVQGLWRSRSVRRRLQLLKPAVNRLKINWRIRREYRDKVASATVIQASWNEFITRRRFKKWTLQLLMLQALARGYLVRRGISRTADGSSSLLSGFPLRIDAVVLIQANWRSLNAKCKYRNLTAGVVALQRLWRRRVDAAVLIQHLVKRHLFRVDRREQRIAAVKIQKMMVRALVINRRNRMAAAAALMVQSLWRSIREARKYKKMISCAVAIQCFWKSFTARQRLLAFHQAIRSLQSQARGYLGKRRFRVIVHGAVTMQRTWRKSRLDANKEKMLAAVFAIQRAWRRNRSRRRFDAAISIQTFWRCFLTCRRDESTCLAILIVQSAWRSKRERRAYKKLLQHVIAMQAQWRSFAARQRLLRSLFIKSLHSATKIQALIKGFLCRLRIRNDHEAAMVIQRQWHSQVAHRAFVFVRRCAIMIQASFRGYLARRSTLQYRLCVASSTIQRVWRGAKVRKKITRILERVTTIQSLQRKRLALAQFKKCRHSAILVQSRLRAFLAHLHQQERLDAAIRIQRCCRGATFRKYHKRQKGAAIIIQAGVRCYVLRTLFLKQRQSAIRLQALSRRLIWNGRFRSHVTLATTLQALWRGSCARRGLQLCHQSASFIQRIWLARCYHRNFLITKACAVRIQALRRGYAARKLRSSFLCQLNAHACNVQTMWRGVWCRALYRLKRTGATLIQSVVRGKQARTEFRIKSNCVLVLQKCTRGFVARSQLHKQREAAKVLQRCWRETAVALMLKMTERECALPANGLAGLDHNALLLQKFVRSFLIRRSYARQKRAVLVLQAAIRSYATKLVFFRKRRSVIRLQALSRRLIWNVGFRSQVALATTLQALWRGSCARRELQLRHQSASFIQRIWLARYYRRNFLITKASAVMIQALHQGYADRWLRSSLVRQLSAHACTIQRMWRGVRCRALYRLKRTSATTIQCMLRGTRANAKFLRRRNAALLVQHPNKAQVDDASNLTIRHWQGERASLNAVVDGGKSSNESCLVFSTIAEVNNLNVIVTKLQSYARSRAARNLFQKMQLAAHSIQVAYFTWKMELALLKVQSSVVLLRRSNRGHLVRSARRFALTHMASSFRSNALASFIRIVTINDADKISIRSAWEQAVCMAESSACIVIQSAARRMLAMRLSARRWSTKKLTEDSNHLLIHANYEPLITAICVNPSNVKGDLLQRFSSNRTSKTLNDVAAVDIQRVSSGAISRENTLRRLQEKIVVLQSYFRMWRAVLQVKKARLIIKVQTHVRRWLALRTTRRYICSALVVERLWRRTQQRKQITRLHLVASVLQRNVSFISSLRRRTEAVGVLQSFARSVIDKSKATRLLSDRRKLQQQYEQQFAGSALANAVVDVNALLGKSGYVSEASICVNRLCQQATKRQSNAVAAKRNAQSIGHSRDPSNHGNDTNSELHVSATPQTFDLVLSATGVENVTQSHTKKPLTDVPGLQVLKHSAKLSLPLLGNESQRAARATNVAKIEYKGRKKRMLNSP